MRTCSYADGTKRGETHRILLVYLFNTKTKQKEFSKKKDSDVIEAYYFDGTFLHLLRTKLLLL